MRNKNEIRKEALDKRDNLSAIDKKIKDELIKERLFSNKFYDTADTILTYVSYKSEVSTLDIIEESLYLRKSVYCPKVLDLKNGYMEFYKIKDIKDLVMNKMGIYEPEEKHDTIFNDFENENTLIIMPGTAFNYKKDRIGYNGGFYDRYLERGNKLKSIALCYECQIMKEDFPISVFDKRPDYLLTENGII
ncbi:MAG: 5-formyltetrahydrofolate cyclo-ligase [Butyrivibrio sp.]|nr:5-formyltetrahydrofolate cyclo-ligase [Butyrivibrio sp.]